VKAARRQLVNGLDRLPAWLSALTFGIILFAIMLITVEAIYWALTGHLNPTVALGSAIGSAVGMTFITRQLRREEQKMRAHDARPPAEP
jgi:hypothetical protein